MRIAFSSRLSAVLLATATMAVAALGLAPAAGAATLSVTDCSMLQAQLSAAGVGDHVQLADGLDCPAGTMYTLPGHAITLEGLGAGATLRGQSELSAMLSGSNVGTTVIRNLTFVGGHATDDGGGAILINGNSAPTLDGDRFLGDSSDLTGGAVSLSNTGLVALTIVRNCTFGSTAAGQGNSSQGPGGALTIFDSTGSFQVFNSVFAGNSGVTGGGLYGVTDAGSQTVTSNNFSDNVASHGGGGVSLFQDSNVTGDDVAFTENKVSGNTISDDLTGSHEGGGALLEGEDAHPVISQSNNLFSGNVIAVTTSTTDFRGGAGEYVDGLAMHSNSDQFIGNTMAIDAGTVQGAGLWVRACDSPSSALTPDTMDGDVVAGNSITGGPGEGAGVYAGCGSDPINLTMRDSTVSGNVTGVTGTGGIWGGALDQLLLQDSIVAGNTGADVTGFASTAVDHSDVCVSGFAFPGTGNICAPPLLAGVAIGDVHELAGSPTIDVGDSSEVPAGLTLDAYGGARVVGTAVDMGAAEFVPAPAVPMPPVTPPVAPPVALVEPSAASITLGERRAVVTRAGTSFLVATGQVVTCPAAASGQLRASCTATVIVTTVVPAQGKVKRHVLTIATATVTILDGHATTISLRLTRAGASLLRVRHSIRTSVTITATHGAAAVTRLVHATQLIAPAAPRRHRN